MNREASVEQLLKELSRKLIQKQELSGKIGVSAMDISRRLNIHRSNVSHYLNNLVREKKAIKITGRPVYFLDREEVEKALDKRFSEHKLIVDNLEELMTTQELLEEGQIISTSLDKSPFQDLIGYNYSLTKQIDQAKAAIMYPPNGLYTLIVGPTGAGKSLFAHKMYQFARQVGIIGRESEFINFNCADYSNNPQLLFSQLFGYTKGAFSGADSDKPGLVEMADGSMLFLDEIHRLSPEAQETLFNLMDYGTFRRLGETEKKRQARVRIVGATTISPDSVLLDTFLRRIPLVIHIPGLDERPLVERMIFIARFFSQEAGKIGVPIKVERDIVRALLLYDCPGNIGQLRGDIQLMFALAFVEFSKAGGSEVIINKNHIKDRLRKCAKQDFQYDDILDQFIGKGQRWCMFWNLSDDQDLKVGIGNTDFKTINLEVSGEKIGNVMMEKSRSYYHFLKKVSKEEGRIRKVFGEVVSVRIIKVAEQLLQKIDFPRGTRFDRSLFFSLLSIHLNFIMERLELGVPPKDLESIDIDRDSRYYIIAQRIGETLSMLMKKEIPQREVDYIAFLANRVQTWEGEIYPRVAVVAISKGDKAKRMIELAQDFLVTDHGLAFQIHTDWNRHKRKSSIIETIREVDEGKGVLLLCEHSLIRDHMKEIKTESDTRVEIIGRVSTAIVVESVRLALEEDSDLNYIVDRLMKMTPEGSSLDLKAFKDKK